MFGVVIIFSNKLEKKLDFFRILGFRHSFCPFIIRFLFHLCYLKLFFIGLLCKGGFYFESKFFSTIIECCVICHFTNSDFDFFCYIF